ncbi:hypothetical protein SAMN05421630_101333 [Prauserella marina]|uniref:Uncharacterized protein n=1 Tax=Prauserella marina TaxID=530584 RepID=A0A1G6IPD3_9PSEU|nr:hypothetical protein DES30_1011003 [Prauserella marina]SDC07626.1 hypothetical protein SAMN05421630_101333 [Prauserella marina]
MHLSDTVPRSAARPLSRLPAGRLLGRIAGTDNHADCYASGDRTTTSTEPASGARPEAPLEKMTMIADGESVPAEQAGTRIEWA